jgi:hypothetical protein
VVVLPFCRLPSLQLLVTPSIVSLAVQGLKTQWENPASS